jgi:hypothetical protein
LGLGDADPLDDEQPRAARRAGVICPGGRGPVWLSRAVACCAKADTIANNDFDLLGLGATSTGSMRGAPTTVVESPRRLYPRALIDGDTTTR